MFLHHFKFFFTFLFAALLVESIIILNYFHVEILSIFPILSSEVIPTVSVCVISVIFYFTWRDEVEKEQSREEFVSVITHKFRTPLTGVKWAIDALRNEITEQQKQEILSHMENSNQRLMEIVDLMVGFAQFDKHLEYAYEATSLREIVDMSLQKYGDQIHAKNVNFQINAAPSLPLVVIDKRKIQFVVDMLIDNALKYTPTGGTITVGFLQSRKHLSLSIHDTGIGIKWSDRGNVFKKYYRSRDAKLAHTEGMGLGLYTAKTIVEKHHGRIWFDSKGTGKGTTFYIKLKIKA
jgi:two-component system, OmpR family, sensor histidine kinase VicK